MCGERTGAVVLWQPSHHPSGCCTLWPVFRALDYLPKVTVVYFLRVRRGTSQHQTRDTNAGGGGVRRNTRRVTPTPEEEEYVATKDAGGGGVRRNTRCRRRRSMSQHKTCDTNAGGGVCCHHSKLISYPHVFFPQSFLIFFINHLTFFL